MRLKDKTAIVVGAGQTPGSTIGNGRAIATLFAREGARVLCVDRVGARAEETAHEIGAEALEADITSAEDCTKIVETALARFGRIDILVNNVGIGSGGDGPAHVIDEAAFDRILAVNLKGAWLIIKAAIPALRESGGAIVNVSSLASTAGAHQLGYEVSKAGMNRLTQSVALSNAKYGVRCNAVLPGFLDTPMAVASIAAATRRSEDEVRAERDKRIPLRGKMGTAWDAAHAVLFLASDEARFITGALLPVDGGMGVRVG